MPLVGIIIFASGCATSRANFRSNIDIQNVDLNRYEADLLGCHSSAVQNFVAGQSLTIGPVAGALLGYLLAAASGGGYRRPAATNIGALTGTVGRAAKGEKPAKHYQKKVLVGQGFRVLKQTNFNI